MDKKFRRKKQFFIRVAGPENNTLFLSLPYQWAEFDIKKLKEINADDKNKWVHIPLKNNNNTLEVASTHLEGGYWLQAGKSTEARERLLKRFRKIFAAVMIPLVLLGFIGGVLLAFRTLRPIRHLIHTVRSISTDIDRMETRVPTPNSGDELDELVGLFNLMLERIDTLIRAMKASLDDVAHDLRTPMTRLRGAAEMALQSGDSLETCREALSDCIEESERILTFLNTVMDISEADTGVMKLDFKTVNVSALIENVVDIYHYVVEEEGIVIHINASRELSVTVDPTRMGQALANLLDNAIKYTPRGGRINIEGHGLQSQVVIVVKDSGIGIPREELPRIWERLYRGDQSRSQKGLGLGLSLVKAIVHAHKGRIEVSSEPDKGSVFTIYLPFENQ